MQVVGQQHPRINGERFLLAHRVDRFPQSHPHGFITQNRLAAESHNRKEITCPLGVSAAVIGHGLSGFWFVVLVGWATLFCPPFAA
jgi:hypothetical protein